MPSLYGTYGQPKKKKKKKKPSPAVTRTKPKLKKKPKAGPAKPKAKPKKAATRTKSLNASLSSADAGKRVGRDKTSQVDAFRPSLDLDELTAEALHFVSRENEKKKARDDQAKRARRDADRAAERQVHRLSPDALRPEGAPKTSKDTKTLEEFSPSPLAERHGVEGREREEHDAESKARVRLKDKSDPYEEFSYLAGVDTPMGAAVTAASLLPFFGGPRTLAQKAGKVGYNALKGPQAVAKAAAAAKPVTRPVQQATSKAAQGIKLGASKAYLGKKPETIARRAKAKEARAAGREAKYKARSKVRQAKAEKTEKAKIFPGKRSKRHVGKAKKNEARNPKQTRPGTYARSKKPTKEGFRKYGKTWGPVVPPAALIGGGDHYVKAAVQDPLAVAATTGRTAFGIPAAMLSLGIDAGKSATGWGMEGGPSTGPLKGQLAQQVDYLRSAAAVSTLSDLGLVDKPSELLQRRQANEETGETADTSIWLKEGEPRVGKDGKPLTAENIVQDDVGVVPIGGLALTFQAMTQFIAPSKRAGVGSERKYTAAELDEDGVQVYRPENLGRTDSGPLTGKADRRLRALAQSAGAKLERINAHREEVLKAEAKKASEISGGRQEKVSNREFTEKESNAYLIEHPEDILTVDESVAAEAFLGSKAGQTSEALDATGAKKARTGEAGGISPVINQFNALTNEFLKDAPKNSKKLEKVKLTGGYNASDLLGFFAKSGFYADLSAVKALAGKTVEAYEARAGTNPAADQVSKNEIGAARAIIDPKNAKALADAQPTINAYLDEVKVFSRDVIQRERVRQGQSEILEEAAAKVGLADVYGVESLPSRQARLDDGYAQVEALKAAAKSIDDPRYTQARKQEAGLKERSEALAREFLDDLAAEQGAGLLNIPARLGDGTLNPAAVEKGRSLEHIYTPTKDATLRGDLEAPDPALVANRGEEHNTGQLAREGRVAVDNHLADQIARLQDTLAQPYQTGIIQRSLDSARAEGWNGPITMTAEQADVARRSGQVPTNFVFIESSRLQTAGLRGANSKDADFDPQRQEADLARAGKDSVTMVKKFALQEIMEQAKDPSKVLRAARYVQRVQQMMMLAVSASWFIHQLVASPMALSVATNPKQLAKAAAKDVKDYKAIDRVDRIMFEANFEGASPRVFDWNYLDSPMSSKGADKMSESFRRAYSTRSGRALQAIGKNITQGGPLIIGNRKFESSVRLLDGIMELSAARAGVSGKGLRKMANATGALNEITNSNLRAVKGMSTKEAMAWLRAHPADAARHAERVNDALGNWVSLTARERYSAAGMVFYPFVRFSTKWLFRTLPAKHPLKLSLAAGMSQANAMELKENGYISNFRDYGKVVTHGQDGEPDWTVDLGRSAPGGGAVVEQVGNIADGDRALSVAAAGIAGPFVGNTVSVAANLDPYSGRPSDKSKPELIGQAVANATPLTRWMGRSTSEEAQTGRSIDPGLVTILGGLLGYDVEEPTLGPLSAGRDILPDIFSSRKEDVRKAETAEDYRIMHENSTRSPELAREAKENREKMEGLAVQFKNGEISEAELDKAYKKYRHEQRRLKKLGWVSEDAEEEIRDIVRGQGFEAIDLDKFLKRKGFVGDQGGGLSGGFFPNDLTGLDGLLDLDL